MKHWTLNQCKHEWPFLLWTSGLNLMNQLSVLPIPIMRRMLCAFGVPMVGHDVLKLTDLSISWRWNRTTKLWCWSCCYDDHQQAKTRETCQTLHFVLTRLGYRSETEKKMLTFQLKIIQVTLRWKHILRSS